MAVTKDKILQTNTRFVVGSLMGKHIFEKKTVITIEKHRWTGHSHVAALGVILGRISYKIEWGKATKGRFVRFAAAVLSSQSAL